MKNQDRRKGFTLPTEKPEEPIFIDVFYNAETCKYCFALIRDNKRIFGADNLRGWHIHPFENPETHTESEPVTLENFLDMIAGNIEKGIFPRP